MSSFIIGLTGGIGSGKTTVSDIFSNNYGIEVVDADVIAREVVAPGSKALQKIQSYFGNQIVAQDGSLDRSALRAIVFDSPEKKNWLNALLHPLIRETMQLRCQQASSPYVILSIPLLVENKLQFMANRILVVDCEEETQIVRASNRDGVGEEQIKSIMRSQASRKERLAIANDVITNEDSARSLEVQIGGLHKKYLEMSQQEKLHELNK